MSVKLQGYQCVHLGRTNDCELAYPVFVQMEVKTGAMESQLKDSPLKAHGFACVGHRQLFSPYPAYD